MSDQPPPLPGKPPRNPKGSLAKGFGLAWAVALGGSVLLVALGTAMPLLYGMLLPLPLVAILVAAIALLAQGRTRTGLGVFLGLASMLALALLLVAACFGLLRMH